MGLRAITLVELSRQANRLRERYPAFKSNIRGFRGGPMSLVTRGQMRPTTISAEYNVRLEYTGRARPKMFIVEPELKPLTDGGKIPHTWGPNEPCLYFNEWRVGHPIADTIIPWTMLWLTFYESWRVTGEWQGGGFDHGPRAGDI